MSSYQKAAATIVPSETSKLLEFLTLPKLKTAVSFSADVMSSNRQTFSQLSDWQQRQLKAQFAAHRHDRYEVDLVLPLELRAFIVHPGVMRPDLMGSSRVLAEFLACNPELYRGKAVIDMGCGSGIQGIVMALEGAGSITFADVETAALDNTRENIQRFHLTDGNRVLDPGDLFEGVGDQFDLIVFNHPFFPAEPLETVPVSRAMMDPGDLIHRFFDSARAFARGPIIMPFFDLAGEANNPALQGPKHRFVETARHHFQVDSGLQQGKFSIHQMELR